MLFCLNLISWYCSNCKTTLYIVLIVIIESAITLLIFAMVEPKELIESLTKNKDERLDFLRNAVIIARLAGEIVEDAFYKLKDIHIKSGVANLVTETDQLVEKLIFDFLKEKYPTHSFIGEESVENGASAKLSDNPTWVVDPVDGTTNFVHMNPNVAVCIGLVVNKITQVGVVLAPILKRTYVGVRGHGAYCNATRLNICNPVASLSQALIASEWASSRDAHLIATKGKNMMDVLIKHGCHGVRSYGSCALNMCFVASNALDLYVEWGPHIWDFAASSIVVQEAGGMCTNADGTELDFMARNIICASSRKLIDEIVPTLTQIKVRRDDE